MLRFAEEIILLLLDDEDGSFAHVPRLALNYALAGGVPDGPSDGEPDRHRP